MASTFKFSNFAVDKFLNVLRGTNITAPTTLYLGLAISNPLDSETTAQVVAREVTDTGYARQPITFAVPADASGIEKIINNINVGFGAFNTGGFTVTHYFLIDAVSGSSCNYWGAGQLESSQTVNAGNTISLNIGNASIGID